MPGSAAVKFFVALDGQQAGPFDIAALGELARSGKLPPIPLTLPAPAPGGAAHPPATPGTMVLALIFLTAFILYYFVNWKYLSTLWGLS